MIERSVHFAWETSCEYTGYVQRLAYRRGMYKYAPLLLLAKLRAPSHANTVKGPSIWKDHFIVAGRQGVLRLIFQTHSYNISRPPPKNHHLQILPKFSTLKATISNLSTEAFASPLTVKMGFGWPRLQPRSNIHIEREDSDGYRWTRSDMGFAWTRCLNCNKERRDFMTPEGLHLLDRCCYLECETCGKQRRPGMVNGKPFHHPCVHCVRTDVSQKCTHLHEVPRSNKPASKRHLEPTVLHVM